MAFLYQIQTDGKQLAWWELGAKPVVVGRGDSVDAWVDDDSLSWGHFMITSEGGEFRLIDLNSSNGAWVNGKRVSVHRLRPGDIISAGNSLFSFSDVPGSGLTALDAAVLKAAAAALQSHAQAS